MKINHHTILLPSMRSESLKGFLYLEKLISINKVSVITLTVFLDVIVNQIGKLAFI